MQEIKTVLRFSSITYPYCHQRPCYLPVKVGRKSPSAYPMTDLSHDGQNLSHELITIFISIIIFCLVIATPYATSDGYFLLLLLPDVGPRKQITN